MNFDELTRQEVSLFHAKNDDYTRGGEVWGNFKRVSKILSLYPALNLSKPEVVCLVYLLKQIDAVLWMLSQEYEGEVEGINSRLGDVSIYAKICRLLRGE